jgi:hypothetical protein
VQSKHLSAIANSLNNPMNYALDQSRRLGAAIFVL